MLHTDPPLSSAAHPNCFPASPCPTAPTLWRTRRRSWRSGSPRAWWTTPPCCAARCGSIACVRRLPQHALMHVHACMCTCPPRKQSAQGWMHHLGYQRDTGCLPHGSRCGKTSPEQSSPQGVLIRLVAMPAEPSVTMHVHIPPHTCITLRIQLHVPCAACKQMLPPLPACPADLRVNRAQQAVRAPKHWAPGS